MSGSTLGNELQKALQGKKLKFSSSSEWEVLDKEIITSAAKELDLPANLAEKYFRAEHSNNPLENLFRSISDHYLPSDLEIKKKVAEIILTMADKGNVIILGRAGAMLTHEMDNSFHVKLYAPPEWRAQQIMKMKNVSEKEAMNLVKMVDRERVYIRKFFAGEQQSDDFFNVTYNCDRMNIEEITSSVVHILEKKGFFE